MPFPIAVLGTTRDRAAERLQPYIEQGRLTEGDAERTLTFVSADKTIMHRALVPAAVGTTVAVMLHFAMSARRISLAKRILVPAGAGTIIGEVMTIKRLRDDYQGWRDGLTDEPAVRGVLRELMQNGRNRAGPLASTPTPMQMQMQAGAEKQNDDTPANRWGELRKEAGVTQASSWDTLRQSKGRAALPPTAAPATATGAQATAYTPPVEQLEMTAEERRFKELMDRESRPST
ncbi:hypothetical protein BD626DRAFT_548138 [Schizophyllum amplum]|uniref:Uncharacterized protein n=1 Tax=Schizophyllum amplum TaxID=97359 RepID=A0A550CEF2_9AGAR|nr:hypothetical protein BD626DRAFT_548138 [Auriculariopsis ampla]